MTGVAVLTRLGPDRETIREGFSANEIQWQMHIMHIGVCMQKENIDNRVIIGYCDIVI